MPLTTALRLRAEHVSLMNVRGLGLGGISVSAASPESAIISFVFISNHKGITMMSAFTKTQFISMLKNAAVKIAEEHEALSQLDAAIGDGDHGVTIHRTMQAVDAATDENADKPLGELAKAVAMKVMMCDGGATSPLLGSYFMGFGNAAPADELDAEQTAVFFEAGLAGFCGISKAELGDKTMMDALLPATETLVSELRRGSSLSEAFNAAAKAAANGAEKTKGYVAKLGRARIMGERSIGHQDPGATSFSHIFGAFAATLDNSRI